MSNVEICNVESHFGFSILYPLEIYYLCRPDGLKYLPIKHNLSVPVKKSMYSDFKKSANTPVTMPLVASSSYFKKMFYALRSLWRLRKFLQTHHYVNQSLLHETFMI